MQEQLKELTVTVGKLKWQQHILKQLIHGIHPSKQNICNILCASSIFYFQQNNEQAYTGFLTTDEITDIPAHNRDSKWS